MTAPPLTHHDILALVAPFTRCGRQVDLAATDRVQRRVVFKPTDRAADVPELTGLRERLELEQVAARRYCLTRTLVLPSGLTARLQATGAEPGVLLRQIDAVPAAQHFLSGEGFAITRHYALRSDALAPVLTSGVVQVDGATLTLTVPAVCNVSANVELVATPGQWLDMPQDLLAVLGWPWSPVSPGLNGWTGKFRLRGTSDKRTRRAEAALELAARHLAQTLAAPPSDFLDQHLAARWRVVLRRAIPVLTPLSMLVTVLAMPRLGLDTIPGLWTLVYQVPTVLIAISFMTQDLPQFEIPPWPRRLTASRWFANRSA